MYKRIGEFFVDRMEEDILHIVAPSLFVGADSLKDASDDYLIRCFQNEQRELLQSYLNGGFSNVGYCFFPLWKGISTENTERAKRLERLSVQMRERKIIGSVVKLPPRTGKGYARFLCDLAHEFDSMPKKGVETVTKKKVKGFDVTQYGREDRGYLHPIEKIQERIAAKLSNKIAGFYLHGSLATDDFVKGWSDCDTLCIVSKAALQDPKKMMDLRSELVEMRKWFYQMDPLQHHGSMVIGEQDLEYYPQSYFPIPLFVYAKSLGQDSIRKLHVRDSKIEAISRLFWFVSEFRRMNLEKNRRLGCYEAKNLLHLIALFPSLYLQAKGVLMYKKFSFDAAKRDFSKKQWEPIEGMTSMRNSWRPLPRFPLIKTMANINSIAAYQLNAKLIDMASVFGKRGEKASALIEGMHKLSETAWENVRGSI